MYDTYLVDGVDLADFGVRTITDLSGGYARAPMRGGNVIVPGRNGEIWVDKVFQAGTLSLGVVLTGDTSTEANDAYRELSRLLGFGRQVTLTRRIAYSTGNEDHTAAAEVSDGMQPQASTDGTTIKAVLNFTILDGLWYGAQVTTAAMSSGPHTRTVTGDVRTSAVTVTFSGGTGLQTVQNFANGDAVSYTGSTSTAVTVDVLAGTATQGGVDVSGGLSMSPGLFRLEAGSQSIVVLGTGTAQISYYPAYL